MLGMSIQPFYTERYIVSSCSEELLPALKTIQIYFPELLRVVKGVFEKPIQIALESEGGFKARWNWVEGVIAINRAHYKENPLYGPIVDLLFEMQNVCYTPLFQGLQARVSDITKGEYVEAFERVERSSSKLTYQRLKSLPQEVFPERYNEFTYTYFEDLELYYLHQQVTMHSFAIAARYGRLKGAMDKARYVGTWAAPLVDEQVCSALHELLSLHLGAFRLGEGEATLRKKIGHVAFYAEKGKVWAQDVLINLEFFNKKYCASQRFSPEVKIPLYKTDCNKLKLLGIIDKRKKDLLLD